MVYHSSHFVKASCKPSPTLLFNNLSCALGKLAYAHDKQVLLANCQSILGGSAVDTVKVASDYDGDVIQSVKLCYQGDEPYLVIVSDKSVQVWDASGQHLIGFWKSSQPDIEGTHLRGVSESLSADGSYQLCVGSSTGFVFVFSIEGRGLKQTSVLAKHTNAITCLGSTYQSRKGQWTDDLTCNMVSCDEAGRVCVWLAQSPAIYQCVFTIDDDMIPCSSATIRSSLIICGRMDGTIRLYGLKDAQLKTELALHSRWLSAMDIHPTRDILATVAEDCTLNVWTLPTEPRQKVMPLLSVTWLNAVLTGVAFCGPSYNDVAASAYDRDEICIWRAM